MSSSKQRCFVVSLCDFTGIAVQPWLEAGYSAVLVDPQHPDGVTEEGQCIKVGRVISHPQTFEVLHKVVTENRVAFTFGWPPCTDVAVSGARWFSKKREADPHFQAKAALVAEQCRTIGRMLGAPWFFENPVSVFSSIFGKPDHIFNPYEYGGYLPEDDKHPQWPNYIKPRDAYPKKTCLWAGGGFAMPPKKPVEVSGKYSTQHTKLGGKSKKTKNIRSASPRGFTRAIFEEYSNEYQ